MSYAIDPPVYSVEQCNELVNEVLGAEIGAILVEGEISNLQIKRNQWVTFDLKDSTSVVNCFASVYKVGRSYEHGMMVRVLARPRIYVPYGKYSLNIDAIQPVGEGALQQAYQLLLRQLEGEGLFEQHRKQPLPPYPERIGLITSPEGAALDDVRTVISGRWGGLQVLLYPVLVQGTSAPTDIIRAIQYFNERSIVDTIILTRGGGSMEDLQAFNTERVARAIAGSKIPVVCAIGHERDTTIAELVADQRAATPSHAAQLAVPSRETVRQALQGYALRLAEPIRRRLAAQRHVLSVVEHRLREPIQRIIRDAHDVLARYTQAARELHHAVDRTAGTLTQYQAGMMIRIRDKLATASLRLTRNTSLLHALNPRAILARGYSFTTDEQSGTVVRSTQGIKLGQRLTIHLADGVIRSEVRHASKKTI